MSKHWKKVHERMQMLLIEVNWHIINLAAEKPLEGAISAHPFSHSRRRHRTPSDINTRTFHLPSAFWKQLNYHLPRSNSENSTSLTPPNTIKAQLKHLIFSCISLARMALLCATAAHSLERRLWPSEMPSSMAPRQGSHLHGTLHGMTEIRVACKCSNPFWTVLEIEGRLWSHVTVLYCFCILINMFKLVNLLPHRAKCLAWALVTMRECYSNWKLQKFGHLPTSPSLSSASS